MIPPKRFNIFWSKATIIINNNIQYTTNTYQVLTLDTVCIGYIPINIITLRSIALSYSILPLAPNTVISSEFAPLLEFSPPPTL